MRKHPYLAVALATLAYWWWESRTGGTIRVDLLLFYPLLLFWYLYVLWPRFRFRAMLVSLIIMALNVAFFINSYSWFHKKVG